MHSLNKFIRYHIIVISFGIVILSKFIFRYLENKDLTWLLRPIVKILEFSFSTQSKFVNEHGYLLSDYNISIDKSCSGFNYLLICFLVFVYIFSMYSWTSNGIKILAKSFVFAYISTILVNSCRLFILIKYHEDMLAISMFSYSTSHQAIGGFIYVFFILLISVVANFYYTNLSSHNFKNFDNEFSL